MLYRVTEGDHFRNVCCWNSSNTLFFTSARISFNDTQPFGDEARQNVCDVNLQKFLGAYIGMNHINLIYHTKPLSIP